MSENTPRRTVSPERKSLHAFGMALMVAGGLGFLICMLLFATSASSSVHGGGDANPIQYWIGCFISMVVAAVGGAMRSVAIRGVAGSGLVLDPQRARNELEPWARMGGGLVKAAIDESGLGKRSNDDSDDDDEQTVMVRCRDCRTLNDEDAKFCDHCGAAM